MNWVEVVWPLVAAVSLVFGLVHLLAWKLRAQAGTHLSLALAAFSLAALAVLERMALFSPSTAHTAAVIRWMQVPVLVLVASLLFAVHSLFGHGAAWLAGAVLATRFLALLLGFTTGVNLNFLRIDHLEWTSWWGVAMAQPIGPPNPALGVALLSNVLLLAYLLQTLLRGLQRQPERSRTLVVVCGACMLIAALLIAAVLSWMMQVPRIPLTLPCALLLLCAVSWQLGRDFIYWNRVESLLHRSELRHVGSRESAARRRQGEQLQLRAVLDASPAALLLVDGDGMIQYANERACSIFGYGGDEMPGMAIDELLPEPYRHGHVRQRAGYLHDPQRRNMATGREVRARRRCGQEFPVEVALSPLHLQGRGYVVAAVGDLSERRSMEQELAFERESMAHMSRVALIGEISGSLAHELNQPLAAILSNAQAAQRILRRDPTELADIREILDDIVDNDRRAGEVISRLRGLLKKEHRVFAPLSVSELVQDSIRVMRNDLISRGVEYRMDLPANVPRVRGDHVQLQQVLLNLIINACDAMAGSSPRVLSLRTSTSANGQVQVEVRDSGPGVPDDMLEAIFAPFQSSKPNGMGMGLAICRTILRAHGGRIWAAPVEGGASFCFELPQVE